MKATQDLSVNGAFKTERISDASVAFRTHSRNAVSPRLLACRAFNSRISQRGQFTLPLAAWGALGALAIIVGLSIALKVESSRIEGLQTDVATAKAAVMQWQASAMECSDSVKQAQEAATAANKRAQDALRKARQANASADAQKRALDAQRGQKLTCDQAVAEVRKGLK